MPSLPVREEEPQPLTRSVLSQRIYQPSQTTKQMKVTTQGYDFLAKYPIGQPLLHLDGVDLRYLLHAACDWLTIYHEEINRLNVFPVPDGDTGTNLVLTLNAAWAAARMVDDKSVESVSKAASAGALQGSRGNSGVILGQILSGFSQALITKNRLSAQDLVTAFNRSADVAYQSVPAPIEGTILTVIREVSLAVNVMAQTTHDLRSIFAQVVAAADHAVRRSPELLPTLKKAGVVDAGGKGLFYILEGMHLALVGVHTPAEGAPTRPPTTPLAPKPKSDRLTAPKQWGFDVQCLIQQPQEPLEAIRQTLMAMGDSVLVEGDSQLVKVHLHVKDPGKPLSYVVRIGFVTNIIVENMDEMAAERSRDVSTTRPPTQPLVTVAPTPVELIGLVAVAPDPGFGEILRALGVGALVDGGPTMNPSLADLVGAVQSLPNRRVLLLPNHGNALLAANQAVQAIQEEDEMRQLLVIPSKSIPQGVAALRALNRAADLTSLAAELQTAMDRIDTGEVTQAVRSAEFDGLTVEVGDWIGLHDGRLVTRGDNRQDVVLALLIQMAADESEQITIYYGADIAQDEAQNLAEIVRTHYPEQDVELTYGGQPHYHYVLSTE